MQNLHVKFESRKSERGREREREWGTRQGNEVSYTKAGKIIWGKKGDQQERERRNGKGNGQIDKTKVNGVYV